MSAVGTWFDTSTNKDIFKKVVRKWWDTTDREPHEEWRKLCLDLKTSDEYERFGRFAGLPYGGKVEEGEEIPIYSPKFGSVKDYEQEMYAMGFRITHKMKKFNKVGLMEKLTKSMKRAMVELKDVEIFKMWNNPTGTTYAAGFDGLSIANNSHTCLDDAGTTYDNYLASSLSYSALDSAKNYFAYMYDDQANVFSTKPDLLVVNYQLERTALEIVKSERVPQEISNTFNYYKGWIDVFSSIRLTSSTAWIVLAKNHPDYGYFVLTSMSPEVVVKDAPDTTLDTIVLSLQYFKYGVSDPRHAYFGNT